MIRGEEPKRRSFVLCVLLFIFVYAGFGVHSPFIPPLLQERGVDAAAIGLFLAAGTAVKLLAAPLAGRIGDRFHALPITLAIAAVGSALTSLLYIGSGTGALLFAIVITHAIFTGPMAPLSDALGLGVAAKNPKAYGWIRGAGSGAFILGIIGSGQIVNRVRDRVGFRRQRRDPGRGGSHGSPAARPCRGAIASASRQRTEPSSRSSDSAPFDSPSRYQASFSAATPCMTGSR